MSLYPNPIINSPIRKSYWLKSYLTSGITKLNILMYLIQ